MQWEEYTNECLKTAFDLEPVDLAVMCALGLAGELEEYLEVRTVDELGDVCWYLAVLMHALGYDESTFNEACYLQPPPWKDISRICEQVKKWRFHGKEPASLSLNIRNLYSYVLTQDVGDLHTEVLPFNVEKLRERYLS